MAAMSMQRAGIPFTFSHDAPVSPQPWVLALVDAGVNRRTPSGRVIGPQQRVTPYLEHQGHPRSGQARRSGDPGAHSTHGGSHHDHSQHAALTPAARGTLALLLQALR